MMMLSMLPVTAVDAAEPHKMPFPVGVDISDRFVGTVHRHDLIEADDVYQVPQTNVITFEPGSYSGWHAHGAMTVVGVAGQGIYQEWGKEAVLINPGDVVQVPAGVSHFHGAVKDSAFQQIVIYDKNWKAPESAPAVHTGPLSPEEYENIHFSDTGKTKAAGKKTTPFCSLLHRNPMRRLILIIPSIWGRY
ncbi:cupin domain-containing protein [uncultured Megasphaera sp.]|uniref:cupin domain-containing protein n=1 Tax=uncultured Megasphaera sp. TaxID=165188 RepID=UPI0025D63664|nr:cupin domain-containing protein [uncultured Megasphaera sp.]